MPGVHPQTAIRLPGSQTVTANALTPGTVVLTHLATSASVTAVEPVVASRAVAILTATGRKTVVSSDQPMLSPDTGDWRPAGLLKPGHRVYRYLGAPKLIIAPDTIVTVNSYPKVACRQITVSEAGSFLTDTLVCHAGNY